MLEFCGGLLFGVASCLLCKWGVDTGTGFGNSEFDKIFKHIEGLTVIDVKNCTYKCQNPYANGRTYSVIVFKDSNIELTPENDDFRAGLFIDGSSFITSGLEQKRLSVLAKRKLREYAEQKNLDAIINGDSKGLTSF